MTTGDKSAHTLAAEPQSPEAALASLQPELDAMADFSQLPHYNLDATFAASVAFATRERIEPLLPTIARLPDFDTRPIERMSIFALALTHANALVLAHSPEASSFDDDAVRGRAMREDMLLVADRLVKRGLIQKKTVDDIRSGAGNVDMVEDLSALRVLLEPFAPEFIARSDLHDAGALSEKLTRSLAQRNGEDPALRPLLEQRRKVASLLTHAYSELHAAVSFIRRRQEDVADFVPSLWVQGERAKKSAEEPKPATDPARPAKPGEPGKPPAPMNPTRGLLPEEPSDHPFVDEK